MNWQVSDLESSRKLKELGVVQRSVFYWSSTKGKNEFECYWCGDQGALDEQVCGPLDTVSAFTCAELGVAFPAYISKWQSETGKSKEYTVKTIKYSSGGWLAGCGIYQNVEQAEAQARSKMLIYLLENKLTTVEEVNARLLGVGNG